jgi:hypothetical protein
MTELHGGTQSIALGGNLSLRAPGLKGKARILPRRLAGTRGEELLTPALDAAMADAGLEEVATIELTVNTAPMPPAASSMRGPDGADAFELEAADPGPGYGQVVMSVDEAGAMHWHFPLDAANQIQPSTTRGGGPVNRYRIPKDVATQPPALAGQAQATSRSLVGLAARKLLKVLIYPIGDAVFGPVIDKAVGFWENRKRPHRVGRYLTQDRNPLAPTDWASLGQGRALLWVHGTFSTSRAAFGGLPPATLDTLTARYGQRSFALDHPSVSASPMENAQWFFQQMPADAKLEVDIVCHSRGGLLSRLMANPAACGGDPQRFSVRRIVLVGVPNAGTPLANPDHVVAFLDRTTTALNLSSATPDWADALEAVLAVVKVIAHAGLDGLDGLEAMRPGNAFIQQLNAQPLPGTELYGIGADFEPAGSGLGAAFCTGVDSVVDRVFETQPNDLVVPTLGMSTWGGALQVPDARFQAFAPARGVMHTQYFAQPETADKLLAWLPG